MPKDVSNKKLENFKKTIDIFTKLVYNISCCGIS